MHKGQLELRVLLVQKDWQEKLGPRVRKGLKEAEVLREHREHWELKEQLEPKENGDLRVPKEPREC